MRFVSKFKNFLCILGILCFPSVTFSMHKKGDCEKSKAYMRQLRVFEDEYGIKLAFSSSSVYSSDTNPNVCNLCAKELSAYPWHAMCWKGHWMCASCFLSTIDKLIRENEELKGFKFSCCKENINSPLACVDYEATNHNKKDCLTCQYVKSYNESLSKQHSERNEYCNGFSLFFSSSLPSYQGNNSGHNNYPSREKVRILEHLRNILTPKNKDPKFIVKNYV